MNDNADQLNFLADLVAKARAKGADAADAVHIQDTSLSIAIRNGEREKFERSESSDLGLRVLIGKRQAIVSSSDFSDTAIDELADRAVAMARVVPEDPFCGLAEESQLAANFPDFDCCDAREPDVGAVEDLASRTEAAALAVDGVTNSEGAEAAWGLISISIAASNGFARSRRASRHSLGVSVLAGEGTGMERDYDYATTVHGGDLVDPETIGRSAGEKTVRRLNPMKVETNRIAVIYDPRVANSLVRHFANAVNGASVARGTTFLKDKIGEKVFADGVSIIDDPHRLRGLRSKAFDAEGVATKPKDIIADGVLETWILDLRSARQLGLATTGNATRGTSSPPMPGTTNLYLAAGSTPAADMIADVERGFYVTELIGMGVNGVTGDYSRGASGFLIENGELGEPVSEVTIAGNLIDMFANLTPADDLEFRYAVNAPTVRIDGMTLAGK